jgi:hypothetical protein
LTVDIFCNKEFVSNIQLAPEPLILKSDGGELIAHHIANVADYNEPVWFTKKAITYIFTLKKKGRNSIRSRTTPQRKLS